MVWWMNARHARACSSGHVVRTLSVSAPSCSFSRCRRLRRGVLMWFLIFLSSVWTRNWRCWFCARNLIFYICARVSLRSGNCSGVFLCRASCSVCLAFVCAAVAQSGIVFTISFRFNYIQYKQDADWRRRRWRRRPQQRLKKSGSRPSMQLPAKTTHISSSLSLGWKAYGGDMAIRLYSSSNSRLSHRMLLQTHWRLRVNIRVSSWYMDSMMAIIVYVYI